MEIRSHFKTYQVDFVDSLQSIQQLAAQKGNLFCC